MSVQIVCHRGANAVAPENTLAAAKRCVDWDIDFLELDVRQSKDGVLYNLHDPSVDRTTDGTGLLADLTSEEIDGLDAGSWFGPKFAGERVPRVDEFLAWAKGRAKVYFDVKHADHEKLIGLVRRYELENDCFFWGDDGGAWALELKERAPELPVKINVRTAEDLVAAHTRFNARIVEVGLKNVTEDLLAAARERRVKVMVRHAQDDAEAFRRIIALKVEMVNLDHADTFLRVAREMGDRS